MRYLEGKDIVSVSAGGFASLCVNRSGVGFGSGYTGNGTFLDNAHGTDVDPRFLIRERPAELRHFSRDDALVAAKAAAARKGKELDLVALEKARGGPAGKERSQDLVQVSIGMKHCIAVTAPRNT